MNQRRKTDPAGALKKRDTPRSVIGAMFAPTEPKYRPEEVEQRLRGMVSIAFPQKDVDREYKKVLAAYRKRGPLSRLLERFLIGEKGEQRRRQPNKQARWLHFVACVDAKRLTRNEKEELWSTPGWPRAKIGPRKDEASIAAHFCQVRYGAAGTTSDQCRASYKYCTDKFGWTNDLVPRDRKSGELPPPPL